MGPPPSESMNQTAARHPTQHRHQRKHELEAQPGQKDEEVCELPTLRLTCPHVNSGSRLLPPCLPSPLLSSPLFTVTVTLRNPNITTHHITSLLASTTTHRSRLSLLHSRLLHALHKLDSRAQENVELCRELSATMRKVHACEAVRDDVQRERDELREEVEKLVERVQVEHDYKKWPVSRVQLSSLADDGPVVVVHQTTPLHCSRSHTNRSSPNHSPYAPKLTHILSTQLSAENATHARTQARAAALEARLARREAELEGCVYMRGMRAREREIRREREKREEEGDGQRYGGWEVRSGDNDRRPHMQRDTDTDTEREKEGSWYRIWLDERGGDGLGLGEERNKWRRRSLRDRARGGDEGEIEEEQIITMLDVTAARNRILESKIRGSSERLVNARVASASVAAYAASSSSSTTTSTPLVSSDKTNVNIRRAAISTWTLASNVSAPAPVLSSGPHSKPGTIASGRARASSLPSPLPLSPPRFPPPPALSPAPAANKTRPQLQTQTQTQT
ncbi:hypothetical protein CVT25_005372 [Psilocybe cyanescens]|uniref:Uncharacterized protein n=1 Tax=Psilocybe cyanescens TaxID=93625 RepID=A0A409XKN7_PSICY|nr:hypothetical protein CVT25_005372 [Psilocybe cyanescens]